MNHYIVDRFMALKHPEIHENLVNTVQNTLHAHDIHSAEDAENARRALSERKLASLERASNQAGEMLGITAADLLKMQEAKAARIRNSGNKRSSRAMDLAAESFVESEREGLSAEQAVTRACDIIGQSFGERTREQETDRKTVGTWLRDLQEFGVTSIPPARRGRPKKE